MAAQPEVLEYGEEERLTALDDGLAVDHAVIQLDDTAPGLGQLRLRHRDQGSVAGLWGVESCTDGQCRS